MYLFGIKLNLDDFDLPWSFKFWKEQIDGIIINKYSNSELSEWAIVMSQWLDDISNKEKRDQIAKLFKEVTR